MADNYLEKRYAEVFGSAGKARSGGLRRPALAIMFFGKAAGI